MKKEELIEMVNSTICENGQRGITGNALNLALIAIIESMGEGGNSSMYNFYARPELTAEQQEHNVQMYAKIVEIVQSGGMIPVCCIDHPGGQYIPPCTMLGTINACYEDPNTGEYSVQISTADGFFTIYPDGSITY